MSEKVTAEEAEYAAQVQRARVRFLEVVDELQLPASVVGVALLEVASVVMITDAKVNGDTVTEDASYEQLAAICMAAAGHDLSESDEDDA